MNLNEDEATALRAWFDREGDLVWILRPGSDRKTWKSLMSKGLAGRTRRPMQLGLSALGIQVLSDLDLADMRASGKAPNVRVERDGALVEVPGAWCPCGDGSCNACDDRGVTAEE